MQSSSWRALFRQIPVAYHEKLSIVTTAGIEICINLVVRAEEDYMLIRGRLSGTTETGRAFFLPYDQINYIGFLQPIPEAELRAIYGETMAPAPPKESPSEPVTEEQPAESEAPLTPTPHQTPPPELGRPPVRPTTVGKNSILERLRARSNSGTGIRPPPDR